MKPQIEGAEGEDFLTSDVFLVKVNTAVKNLNSDNYSLAGKNIVFLGGNSAMDCARCAVRLSAAKVICIARKTINEFSANKNQLRRALAEGMQILDRTVVKDDSGLEIGILIEQADRGRRILPADLVISAWSLRPKKVDGLAGLVTFQDEGTISTDEQLYAGNRIYAAGDAALGADLVTDSVAQGRVAAKSILEHINESGRKEESLRNSQKLSLQLEQR